MAVSSVKERVMSWNCPETWKEILGSIERGFSFQTGINHVSTYMLAVCGDPRRYMSGFHDDFAQEVIVSYDGLHARYMSAGRVEAWKPDTVKFVVMIDREPVMYATRGGDIKLNPANDSKGKKHQKAVAKMLPALETYADYLRTADWI
jgi:hypothetical protein